MDSQQIARNLFIFPVNNFRIATVPSESIGMAGPVLLFMLYTEDIWVLDEYDMISHLWWQTTQFVGEYV